MALNSKINYMEWQKKCPFDLNLLSGVIAAVGEIMSNSQCTLFQILQAPVTSLSVHFIITIGGI